MRGEGTREVGGGAAGGWLAALAVGTVSLAVWPGAAAPFSQVKSFALLGLGLLAALLGMRAPAGGAAGRRWRVLAGLWLAGSALSALVGEAASPVALAREVGAGLLLLGLLHVRPPPGVTRRAAAGVGAAVAGVALLQAAGADPFGLLGWAPEGAVQGRMRVYGTLGNPTFVAALLGATVCLTVGEAARAGGVRARVGWGLAAAAQVAALACTRSWGALLALAAAGGMAGVAAGLGSRRGAGAPGAGGPRAVRRVAVGTGAALVGALLVLALSVQGRALERVLGGRLYLWRVAAPHVVDAPLLGQGPGSVEARWAEWEAAHWQGAAREGDARYRGPQDHVHQDVLEWLLELGLLGALPRLALLALALWSAVRAREAALAAALTALLVRAQVDFPLQRPAELCLLVVLVALSTRLDLLAPGPYPGMHAGTHTRQAGHSAG